MTADAAVPSRGSRTDHLPEGGRKMDKLVKLVVAMQLRLMGAVEEREEGATATEYALLVALIAIIIAAGVGFFGSQLNIFFNKIGTTVQGWT
jgi:pilus assembly protein Flp/PilA